MSGPQAHRPVFLDLARIRFPVGAVASIAHRISGLALVALLPFAVLALERSLAGGAASATLLEPLPSPAGRIALLAVAWACAHHLFAGIRHLLMDVGVGASLPAARRSAYAALAAGAAVAIAVAVLA